MLLAFTAFENWTIALGFFTALGTVGATVAAVMSTIFKSINRLSIRNCEQRLNLDEIKDYDDVIVRNKSGHDITISTILFSYKENDYHINYVYYANKKVKLPITLKQLESFHIKSLINEILIGIVPTNDFIFVKDKTEFAPDEEFYTEYYDKKHIKVAIIDADQYRCCFKSKFNVTSYLQDYSKHNLLSPWKIESVREYVKEKKTPCIVSGSWQGDFKMYIPKPNVNIITLENTIKHFAYECFDEFESNPNGLAVVFENELRYYVIKNDDDCVEAEEIIAKFCDLQPVNDIAKLTIDYLLWSSELNTKSKKVNRKRKRSKTITFDELMREDSQNKNITDD